MSKVVGNQELLDKNSCNKELTRKEDMQIEKLLVKDAGNCATPSTDVIFIDRSCLTFLLYSHS